MQREWYDLCVCGNHSKPIVDFFFLFFFFTNLLASPGKWESVFSFSSTAKSIHLDKSFRVMLSFKILFLQKHREAKTSRGVRSYLTKANSLVWAIFRWYHLDTSGVIWSLFDKVFTCFRTFLNLHRTSESISHFHLHSGKIEFKIDVFLQDEKYTSSEIWGLLLTAVII